MEPRGSMVLSFGPEDERRTEMKAPEEVAVILRLHRCGWGSYRIGRELKSAPGFQDEDLAVPSLNGRSGHRPPHLPRAIKDDSYRRSPSPREPPRNRI